MRLKIDTNGNLEIERRGKFIPAVCPFLNGPGGMTIIGCGARCPLFGEPLTQYAGEIGNGDGTARKKYLFGITICQDRELWADEIIDERVRP